MGRVLRKRLLRELRSRFLRYAALALLIAMGMYVVVSVVGAADSVIAGSTALAEENRVEDGQFHIAFPLTEAEERTLTGTGIILEKMFSTDLTAADGSVIRLMKNREQINRIALDEGRPAEKDGEIVLEKHYCAAHGLVTGDEITIAGQTFRIAGTGSTPDYELPLRALSDVAAKSARFSTGFVTGAQYERMQAQAAYGVQDYCYAYRICGSGETDEAVRENARALSCEGLPAGTGRLLSFLKRADNPRILSAAGDARINRLAGLFAGVIVMALFTYVISVFVVHQIQRESSVIGALYALGAKKRDLLIHYTMLPALLTLAAGAAGALAGFGRAGIPVQMADSCGYFSMPELSVRVSPFLLVYSLAMPVAVSVLVNACVIHRRLSQPALALLRKEQSEGRAVCRLPDRMKFAGRFRLRHLLRERRAAAAVVCGMFLSFLVLMLGLNCYVLCKHVERDSTDSVQFRYMYALQYPGAVPEGGEACYVRTLSKTAFGDTVNLSVIGIDADNRYFDAAPVKGVHSLVIGKSVQEKYGLRVGDTFVLTDREEEKEHAFTVGGVCGYANGLAVFMDIGSMRELFGQEKGYYNLLLSGRELAIDGNQCLSVTTRTDVKEAASVFTSLMMPLVTLMCGAAVLIFCMVLYLMMGVMIDRSASGISLLRIFGFRAGEVRKLYLNGNAWIVTAGAAIGIPLAKVVMDAAYPWLIANTACGMNLKFPWYLYAGIFAGVAAVYAPVHLLLVHRLRRVTPAEVLKQRE